MLYIHHYPCALSTMIDNKEGVPIILTHPVKKMGKCYSFSNLQPKKPAMRLTKASVEHATKSI